MKIYVVSMQGWHGVETYTIKAVSEQYAVWRAYKKANCAFASLIEIERLA